jgi:thiol-disulfide isomerase/thioredoxin
MDDIYILLLVLVFLVVISQCTNSSVENFDDMDGVKQLPNQRPVDLHENDYPDGHHSRAPVKHNHNEPAHRGWSVLPYVEHSLDYADANKPYGHVVPVSLQQDYATLKSFGELPDNLKHPEKVNGSEITGKPSESMMPAFDPSSKGGLLLDVNDVQDGTGGNVEVYMVYASWCGWSKKTMPIYEPLLTEMNVKTSSGKSVVFKMVEENEPDFEMFKGKVQGFPSFMYVEDGGEPKELEINKRTTEAIMDAAKQL